MAPEADPITPLPIGIGVTAGFGSFLGVNIATAPAHDSRLEHSAETLLKTLTLHTLHARLLGQTQILTRSGLTLTKSTRDETSNSDESHSLTATKHT